MAAASPFIAPMECRESELLPDGPQWHYELKLDGYRALAAKDGRQVSLFSRRGLDLGARFPSVLRSLERVKVPSFLADGELIAVNEEGRHSFQLLQGARPKGTTFQFFAFDLLSVGKRSLAREPLIQRRERLENTFAELPEGVRVNPVLHGSGETIFQKVRELQFEGLVAKRLDSPYRSGEAPGTWLKRKTSRSEDLLVGGYLGAGRVEYLLVGEEVDGALQFVASVGAGFVPATRRSAFQTLRGARVAHCPFANLPEAGARASMTAARMREVHWVRPTTFAEIAFSEWTERRRLRHARFVRLRDDK